MADEKVKARFNELADRSYSNGIYTFTDFLSMAEISDFHELERELAYASPKLCGGHENAEREMIRFGNPEELGYEMDFPIDTIKISPVIEKFSDDLSHRDFLGALMNLGIERDRLGDIMVSGNSAFVFCEDTLTDFICENLTRIKHTTVVTKKTASPSEIPPVARKEQNISVASERADAVIAKLYNLSRSEAALLFTEAKVFVNGRLSENESRKLAPGDVVSVRGFGKFDFVSLGGLSRKGKQYVTVAVYV